MVMLITNIIFSATTIGHVLLFLAYQISLWTSTQQSPWDHRAQFRLDLHNLPAKLRAIENSHHDDVIKWKHFPRYCPFVREIHRWPVNSPHKKGSDVELWCFLWSVPEQTVAWTILTPVIRDAIALIITSVWCPLCAPWWHYSLS